MLATTVVLLGAPPALAGRLLVTGHDADLHCSSNTEQCHFVQVATEYVRAGAPNPSKPLLVLDNGALQLPAALTRAYAPNPAPPTVVMDPSSPAFAAEPLDVTRYSAILIASDSSCGGCDLNQTGTADSDAITRRRADIAAFYNDGGGIYTNAGASHGSGATGTQNAYYAFLPISAPGAPVTPPFKLTPLGAALGFVDDPANSAASDINCCPTHNSFTAPTSGPLQPTELDSMGLADTLIASGTIGDGRILSPVLGTTGVAQRVRGTVRIKLPGRKRFTTLKTLSEIPVGSTLDTKKGTVRLTTARDVLGNTQSAIFYAGQFVFRQARAAGATTDLVLAGPTPKRCGRRGRRASTGRARRARKRSLWGSGKGAFRTVGRYSAATVRGTFWLTEDRCNGTFTAVRQGVVSVFDSVRSKTVLVSAGHTYLAKPRRAR